MSKILHTNTQQRTPMSLLDQVKKNQSLLKYGIALQNKAATVGFDWPSYHEVIDKMQEELSELKEAIEEQNQTHIEEEFGDVLFVLINLARHLEIDPDKALENCCQKFQKRFNYIEKSLIKNNKDIQSASLDEMENLWNEAKSSG
ncbi:MAG: nucleotide pyrophosphohydrolase [Gammaproteobacteria bacterium CG22_combo_CG10-13_8_21_14_all_40_8]|nr:MAG: nucleotide pyrophosphohydrolase [Gammaproteobacteria bacterium CG22_combo_CG10-13_8_21_14_all_40_8]